MLFFFISLLLSLTICGAVLAGLIKSLRINWERRNRRPIGYLAPVLLTAAFILLGAGLAAPHILDTVALAARDYESETVVLKQEDIGWSSLESQEHRFYYNRWQFKPEAGKTYQLTFTPHSRYIIDMRELANPE